MPKASPIQSAFNGGEWSPLMEGRVHLDKYRNAVRKSFNAAALAQGPFIRRSGTRFTAPQRDHSFRSKMIEFQFSATDAFVVGFEHNLLRIMSASGVLLNPSRAVTALVSTSPVVFAVEPGHGFAFDQEVFLDGFAPETPLFQAFARVTGVSGNNITLTGITVPLGFALSGGERMASVFTVSTPYSAEKLPSLRSVQSANTLFLFLPGIRTQVFKRNSVLDWPMRDFKFEDGPYLPVNDTPTTLKPTSTGNAITSFNPANAFSSSQSAPHPDEHAFDEDLVSFWESSESQSGAVGYDFAIATPLRGYVLYGPQHGDITTNTAGEEIDHSKTDFYANSWRFEGSNDGVGWTVLDTQLDHVLYKHTRSPFFKLKAEPSFSRYRLNVLGLLGSGEDITPRIHELMLVPALASDAGLITFNASSTTGINNGQGFLPTDIGRPLRLKASDQFWRWYIIEQVNSPTQIEARQQSEPLPDDTPIIDWRLGLFSDTTGWPTCAFFFEDRLILGGGTQNPDLVAASVPGSYERFSPTDPDGVVTDANGWTITLTGRKVGAVRWIQGDSRGLVVGTLNGPFIIRPLDGRGSLTPTNAKARPISGRKCADMESLMVDNQILSVPISKRTVREITYTFNSDGYSAPSMTLLASHIGTSKFVKMSYAEEPHSIVWIPREDGVLAGFTYNREEDVLGWHRHGIGGGGIVEDVAVIPSPDASVDDLWLSVKRTINGVERRFYEVLQPFYDEASSLDTAWFVDCGFLYEGLPVTEVTGLWKIEGALVSILADGQKVNPRTVTNGKVTLPFAASRVVVGFGYATDGETLRPEAGAADGTAQGKTQRTHKATIRLWETVGGQAGPPGNLQDIVTALSTDEPGARIEPFTGDHLVDWPDGYTTENTIGFGQPAENPLPFNVVAIMPQLFTQDGR